MDNLQRPEVLLVFTYALAGLGHLRVTDALYDGLPEGINSVLLGADDTKITYWHRLMSLSPFFRGIMEWFQEEKNEHWFDSIYTWSLKKSTGRLYQQMVDLVGQQWQEKKVVVVVSTHFGLAHQMAEIKGRLEEKLKIKIILAVQVTDATTMKIWYVPGADLLSVPSEKVKTGLTNYAIKNGLEKAGIMVIPYPLNRALGEQFKTDEYQQRLRQYSRKSKAKIRVVMPISGAAVGLDFYDKLAAKLIKSDERFWVYFVIMNNLHTKPFIKKMKVKNRIAVIENSFDKEVINSYDKLYREEVIGFEVVKPSEQSFKALLKPDQRGGPVLLLMEAVGKQEEDNLDFLADHKLLPNQEDQNRLQSQASEDKPADEFLKRASYWKAIKLTNDPDEDVKIINRGIKTGVFKKMAGREKNEFSKDSELAGNGVEQFWEKVDELVEGLTK